MIITLQVKYEEELLKHCANEEYGDINKITYLLNQSGVDPNNIYDEVFCYVTCIIICG